MKWLKAVLAGVPSFWLAALPVSGEMLERVVAKVNGDIVTLTEFTQRQVAAAQAARIPPDGVATFLRENNARILQEAIDDLLVVQRAEELGIKLRPEMLDSFIEDIKTENNIQSEEELLAQLRDEGMTLSDLKRSIERSVLRRQVLMADLESKTKVTDEDLVSAYEDRRATEFSRPATVKLQEIVLEGEDARREAEALAARSRAGEDFSALARLYSASPSHEAGGELGTIAIGEMSNSLRETISALEPGGVSDPIPTGEAAYQILRVVERTPASVAPYEEVKEELRTRLTRERMEKEYTAYVEGLRKPAIIEIKIREARMDVAVPETPTAATAGTSRDLPVSIPELDDELSITGDTEAVKVAPPELPGPDADPRPDPEAPN
jgi:peptidyl-prolyl cis-trans isomerase SurA